MGRNAGDEWISRSRETRERERERERERFAFSERHRRSSRTIRDDVRPSISETIEQRARESETENESKDDKNLRGRLAAENVSCCNLSTSGTRVLGSKCS